MAEQSTSEIIKAAKANLAAKPSRPAPNYKGREPGSFLSKGAPYVTSGSVGKDSSGYSMLKAAAFCMGAIAPDQCKEEIEINNRLKGLYSYYSGWSAKGFLMPTGTALLPVSYDANTFDPDPDKVRFVNELRQKVAASQAGGADPDELRWLQKKGIVNKALGTLDDTAGGSIVGFPTLGEVIDLQRNREVFSSAGAQQVSLPPNGRISFPKLTGGATAYMVGEASTVTSSQPTTGSLLLEAKKLGIRVPINNELFRFANPTAESVVRGDMAAVAALKADQQMLEGTGGTSIRGLITYDGTTAWSQGTDKIILHTAQTTGTDGDTFTPEDVALMEGSLPDAVDAPTAWIMRRKMFAYLKNRRADGPVPGDSKGQFLFDITRSAEDGRVDKLYGTKTVLSNQVSNTRAKGSATDLTYILLGYFPDWMIARFGVMEFLANPWGDTAWQNDQTELRGIQHLDAGPRHPASFIFCDDVVLA